MGISANIFPLSADIHGGEVEGYVIGSDVSVIVVDYREAGQGPNLHSHPYPETFVVLEGTAVFQVGDETVTAGADRVLVAPAGVPHRFENAGPGRLRQVDIHSADRLRTDWLETVSTQGSDS